jgi:Restriction endonuclease
MAPRAKLQALTVACPKCGSGKGRLCVGSRQKTRKSFHAARHANVAPPAPKKPRVYPSDWAATRAKVFALKGSQCVYCGADASHVDHIHPRSRGGSDAIENLAPSCSVCNVAKGSMTLEEWRAAR